MAKYGVWIKEPRTADCPVCESDSMGVRRLEDDPGSELRRCVDNSDHEFTAPAYVTASLADSTRFDVRR